MPRALLLIAIVITLLVLLRRVQQLPPHKRRGGYIQLTLGVALVATVLLTLLGRMHWIGAAVTGLFVLVRQLLPILVRGFPLLQRWLQQRSTGASGAHSEVKTALLKMTLDHESGDLDGEVLVGTFKEWRLSELSKDQLLELMDYSREYDPDSAQLLTNYLDQRFPGGWDGAEADASENEQSSAITTKEALAVLGLADGASEAEIVAAHRKLMQKMHPDRGGNDYLAAKINEAKDFLLKG